MSGPSRSGGPVLASAQLIEIAPGDVLIPERIGFLHEDKAAALGRLMAVDGQRDPIKVVRNLPSKPIAEVAAEGKKPWRLVTGMHRLTGALIEGIPVFAIEVTGKPEDLADLEASENLHRRPLGPIERAKFTAALVQAAQERIAREHGELSHQKLGAKARWDRVRAFQTTAQEALNDETEDACAKIAQAYGWEESVGEALGMSRRTIHNDLALFRLLIEPFPDLIEALSKHKVVGENASQLKIIAQVREEAQRRIVIEALLADDELSADEAKVQLGIGTKARPDATPVAHQKFFDQIKGGWGRLGLTQKRQFLPSIAGMVAGEMKRDLRDLLNEQLGEIGEQGDQLVPALETAFDIIARLAVGGEPVTDEELELARSRAQRALFRARGADLDAGEGS